MCQNFLKMIYYMIKKKKKSKSTINISFYRSISYWEYANKVQTNLWMRINPRHIYRGEGNCFIFSREKKLACLKWIDVQICYYVSLLLLLLLSFICFLKIRSFGLPKLECYYRVLDLVNPINSNHKMTSWTF